MKKKLVTMLLATTMVASMFAGCGSDGGSKNSSDSGSVYMLNFKPETDQAWQDLAKEYSDEKGVDVTVVTAADGQYKTQLQSELAKKEAPTIFNIGSTSDCAEYADYIYDLKDSEIYKHQSDKSLSLEYDGKVAAVANCYECYGIIYNKAILENYCKNYPDAVIKSVDDIKDLDTLEKVATDINSNVDKINEACGTHITEAFASAGLDDGSNWRFSGHLAGIELYYEFKDAGCDLTAGQGEIKGTYLDNYKRVWDMYTNTSAADKATLDFLEWVITSDDGRKAITETMGLSAPFDTFTGDFASKNGFAAMAAKYVEDGKTSVAWSFNATPSVDSWRADVVAPLTEYTERDGSWDDVEKAFVDQWAYYWNLSNEE